ncbi:MAG: DUF2326 domain-containing protein [Candidatus Brocadiales bacterium]|nr:DUF2326 domain-containing protein [Candidatus Brocadiales bacterium]
MIYSVKSDKSSFKKIDFQPGLNVILAERTKESTRKDSRNGLGKSTLIEIIHFCLGANKGETLSKKELDDWSFTIDLGIAGKKYSVTRNTSKQNKIIIDGDCTEWPIPPDADIQTGSKVLSKNDWNKTLGVLMFGLKPSYDDMNYVPTFRSLISYFVRRNGQMGAFLNPFQHYKQQRMWDIQVNNSYLLGLGWEFVSRLQVLKDREKILDQIKQEAQSGILANLMGTLGELEAVKVRVEAQTKQEEEDLRKFKVHPQYSNIESEANDITRKIHELINENINGKRLLGHYETSINEEVDAKPESVTKIYEEAGFHLPDLVTKRIDDVLSFHKQVVSNRKNFLKAEIERIKTNIVWRENEKQLLSSKRAELMLILKGHGALEEYTQLQNHHQKTVSELKDLVLRIGNLRKFEQGKSELNVEIELLQQQSIADLSERKVQKEKAILLFNSNSQALYKVPGTLSIDVEKTGLKFDVSIERSGSHGIGNMKIFCYDLMLAQIWAEKEVKPAFLIHDSIIFADVDERQKALALELAAKESARLNFQYIGTMNSDAIPTNDFSADFKFDDYVRRTFTDATEDGGLLGIRF